MAYVLLLLLFDMTQDISVALRVLRKRPGASAVVVLTLALGIAVNATFFTFFNGMILHPLPFEDPDGLVYLSESQPKLGKSRQEISVPNLRDWQAESNVFEAIAPYANRSFNLHTEEDPERVRGTRISSTLFPLLGIGPALGRNFTDEDDRLGAAEVALISHTMWQRRFDAAPSVLGRTIHLNERVHEVVGVMPAGFRFENFSEVWTPLRLDPKATARDNRWLTAIARLRPGVIAEIAQVEMGLIGEPLEARYPETNTGWNVRVRPLRDAWLPPVTQLSSYIQQAAVFFVLLIVCANVANLMLAQTTARRQETALRAALGAGRARLVRQFLTESTILALTAGVVGTILALWGVVWIKELVLVPIPYWLHFELDAATLAYSLIVTLSAGLAFGLMPALRGTSIDLYDALKAGGSGRIDDGASGSRLRSLLVVSQFAMSLVLLVGALLMVKSIVRIQNVDVGYETERVFTLRLSVTGESYQESGRRAQFLNEALERISTLNTVEAVGGVNYLPSSRSGYQRVHLEAEGQVAERGEERFATYHTITEGYLRSLEIPLTDGRDFTPEEIAGGRDVAILGASLAEQLWPTENAAKAEQAIGRRIRLVREGESPWLRVVGVVRDVEPAYQFAGLDSWPETQLDVPYGQDPAPMVSLAVRTKTDPALAAPVVREALLTADSSVPVFDVLTMKRLLDVVQWVPILWSQQFSLFAGVAWVIAAMGVYAVTAYSVSRRNREMGIRIALGAGPIEILGLVVRQGMVLGVIGVAVGLAGAIPLTQLLSSLLYEVSASDPTVFVGVTVMLILVAALASYIPARRAASVDPAVVLRAE